MDIHPPHGAPRSVKDFLLQLLTITVGVLIALSIEGILEWRHHRALVAEAREMIAREIDDNRRDLAGELAGVAKRNKDLGDVLQFTNELLAGRKTDVQTISPGASLASLNAASWQSAERTGALSYMDYAEVKEYSKIYSLQELFSAQQRTVLASVTSSLSILAQGDPHKAPPRDLEIFRSHLLTTVAEMTAEEQLGRQLLALYEESLKR